jgi:GNAT superfamily N-acetyltransferase
MPLAPQTDATTLRDGSHVVIRPLRRGDCPALAAAFERLGEQSRYRRFLGPMPTLTDLQLRHLTDVDQRDHVALAAIDTTFGSGIVGVGRFIRVADDDVEPALAVVDDWQARGLGTVLLGALVDAARAQGVRRFRAYVLADNADALRLLSTIGQLRKRRADPAVHVTVDLPKFRPAPSGRRGHHVTSVERN